MDLDDAADLLGNNEMPVRQQRWWGLLRTAFHIIFYGSSLALLWLAYYNGRIWLRNWREYNYKKSVRRKYGIPDTNNEPFNVAYAKAAQRRKEMAQRMAQQQASSLASNLSAAESVSSAGQEGAGPSVSHRRNVPGASDSDRVDPSEASLKANSRTFAPQQKSSSSKSSNIGLQSQASDTPHVASKAKSDVVAQDFASAPRSQRKRSLEKDGADESTKKSRNEHIEPIDLNAQDSSMDVVGDEAIDISSPKPARGAKRQAASDEDITNVGSIGKKAGKRARRQSRKLHEAFNGDENDASMDVDHISRGKKRDRNEAESSFGGDDDLAASGRGTKNRRHKRKSNVSTDMDAIMEVRGTKRSYEVESTLGSDDEVDNTSRSTLSRKRGKLTGRDSTSDVSMNGMDPACAGRKIGEEWLVNGETFKVGPDGRRRRQVLLRKRRSRFSMPEDSQHPDTQAHLEILVETWLNDDDFKAAEERGDIFIPEKESKDESPVSKAGKQLLWSTPQKGTGTPKKAFRNSSVINVGVATDPFKRPSLTGYGKRISIGSDSPITPSTPSPTIRQSKSYSKWEKQDLEAEAMARLRKKLEEEKKVATPPSQKKVSFQLPPSESSAFSAAPSIASSTSAPATLPPTSTASKPDGASSAPSTGNLFAPPSNGQAAADATVPSASTVTANESSYVKPSKDSTATSAPKFSFGQGPSGAQPTTASSEGTGSSTPLKLGNQATGLPATATVPTPNLYASKAQNDSNAATGTPTTMPFARPSTASNVQTSAPKVATLGPSGFSFGNTNTAQGGKATQAPSPFAFGKPTEKSASSVPSPFGATANGRNGASTMNAISFGSGSAGASTTPAAAATNSNTPGATPQISFGATTNKAPDSANKSIAHSSTSGVGNTAGAPKFNFGFGSKPTGPSVQMPGSMSAPKLASSSPFSGSGFPTQSTSATTSTLTAGSSAAAPAQKITFGASGTQPSAASASGQATASNGFGGNKAFTAPAQTSTAPASTGPMFNFGASNPPAAMTSAPSPFGATPSSSSSPFGAAAKSSETRSAFGTAPTAFGSTTNSTTMSSPFGAQAKPAGEVPKPLFGFGSNSNATTGSAPAGDNQNNQNNKPTFSFNFGATPTPAFGSSTAIQQNGASTTSAFGNAASGSGSGTTPVFTFGAGTKPAVPTFAFGAPAAPGNVNGSNTGNTNVFGSNNGTSAFGGQK